MGRYAGWALIAVAGFMFIGYLGADVSGPAAIGALLVAVALPAAAGIALIRGGGSGSGRLTARREALRRDTLQAELLRLAAQHAGRLTIVEAVAALAITPEEAKERLDALTVQGIADFEVTDSGVIVYVFHDVQRLDEKTQGRGLLE